MNKKPRVCIVRQYYFPQEVHLRRDVKALREAGFEVDVICARDKGEKLYEEWNGVNIYRIPVRHLRKGIARYLYEYLYFFVRATLLLTELFFKKNYDCIEVDTMPDFLVFCTIIPKLFKRKIILYLFENMPMLFAEKQKISPQHLLIKILKIVELLCIKFADQIITTHRRKEKYFEKSLIILNVPDEEIFYPAGEKMFSYEISQSDIYNAKESINLITHSTLTEIYGIQNIIKAISALKEKYPKVICIIIGTGEYQKELIALSRSLGLDDYVHFKGFIPFEKIAEELKKADIGIVSVLNDYLLPNKLFEYICLGIPVICSSIKAVRDFFYDDELIFYNPNDYQELANCIEWTMFHYNIAVDKAKKAWMKYRKNDWHKLKNLYINCHHQSKKQL